MRARAAVILALAFAPREASAQPAGRAVIDALHVEPNACFDAAALAPHVSRWLARASIDPRIEVEVRGDPRAEAGVSLTLRRDGVPLGTRALPRFDAPCDEVRAAVALAAALAVDATVLESIGIPAPPPASPPRPAPPPASATRVGVAASIEGVALFGVFPSPAPAIAPSLDLTLTPAFALRLAGLATASSSLGIAAAEADVSLLAARADACGVFSAHPFIARACGGFAAGRLQAAGTAGLRPVYSPAAPWAALAARVDGRLTLLSWLHLALSVDAFVPLVRPSLDVVDGLGAVLASRRLPAAGAAVGLGPAFIFR